MISFAISRNRDVLRGLRLSGIDGVFCKDKNDLKKIFLEIKEKKNIGLIILTESDFNEIEEEVTKVKIKNSLPLIVTIPGINGLEDKNFILKYIKDSIGLKI